MTDDAQRLAETVARRSYGKLIAFLAARTRDVAAAEDALSDAFAAALSDWPENGCPENPEGWLMTVARRRIIDGDRRHARGEALVSEVIAMPEQADVDIPDRRLASMFACAHPAIDESARAPLMLQVVVGLDARAIASAFLLSPDAMSKRLVRAKTKIREAGIPFRVPEREELPARLDTVLDAIYASFTRGASESTDGDAARIDLTGEALFLAKLVVDLLPDEPEALGLLALMLHSHARRAARRSDDGEYVPLSEHDISRWDNRAIDEADTLLRRASTLGRIGRYQLEGVIQSAHAERRRTGCDNRADVVQLYDVLLALTDSPVIAINRALAIAELRGARAGLDALSAAERDKRLAEYQPYWAARAALCASSNDFAAARAAYEVAIGLERDAAVRQFLMRKRAALPDGPSERMLI